MNRIPLAPLPSAFERRKGAMMFIAEKAPGEARIIPSVETMLEWVEKQPATKEYEYIEVYTCACGQFAQAINCLGEWLIRPDGYNIWNHLDRIAYRYPRTFGALAYRLREENNVRQTVD
jgi:hypothetical protein